MRGGMPRHVAHYTNADVSAPTPRHTSSKAAIMSGDHHPLPSHDEAVQRLQVALHAGDGRQALRVLQSLDAASMISVLRSTGFRVDQDAGSIDRSAVFDQVKEDLAWALARRAHGQPLANSNHTPEGKVRRPAVDKQLTDGSSDTPVPQPEALKAVQAAFSAKTISVRLPGAQPPAQRDVLLMLTAQAMDQSLLGFGFEGIPGKYEIPLNLAGITELHRAAAAAVANEQFRHHLRNWVQGQTPTEIGPWLPDSVQRLLTGPVSVGSAEAALHAMETGVITRHAGERGAHTIEGLLRQRGLDPHAPTVEQQASALNLEIAPTDRARGRYFGPVVATDHRAVLIKHALRGAILINRDELPAALGVPTAGTPVRVRFHSGNIDMRWNERHSPPSLGR